MDKDVKGVAVLGGVRALGAVAVVADAAARNVSCHPRPITARLKRRTRPRGGSVGGQGLARGSGGGQDRGAGGCGYAGRRPLGGRHPPQHHVHATTSAMRLRRRARRAGGRRRRTRSSQWSRIWGGSGRWWGPLCSPLQPVVALPGGRPGANVLRLRFSGGGGTPPPPPPPPHPIPRPHRAAPPSTGGTRWKHEAGLHERGGVAAHAAHPPTPPTPPLTP